MSHEEKLPIPRQVAIAFGLILIIIVVGAFSLTAFYQSPYTIKGVGYGSQGEWLGDWWTFTSEYSATVDRTFTLNKDEVGFVSVAGTQLGINSTVNVGIVLEAPYFSTELSENHASIYPEVYGFYDSQNPIHSTIPQTADKIPLLQARYRKTGDNWTVYLPFTITVWKDGEKVISEKFTLSTMTVKYDGVFSSAENETVRLFLNATSGVKPLSTALYEFRGEWFESDIEPTLSYDSSPTSFSCYWFGCAVEPVANDLLPKALDNSEVVRTMRYKNKPIPLVLVSSSGTSWIDPSSVNGWHGEFGHDGIFQDVSYYPLSAPVSQVLSYLKSRHQTVDPNLYQAGISVSEGRMQIFVPREKVSWSCKLDISSELADTYLP